MRDEGELIRLAKAGDVRAFEDLVVLKRERVIRTAWQVLGDLEDARDVAQGVFLRLWKTLDGYDPKQKFDTWLYRITVNAAIDLLRNRGARGGTLVQPLADEHAGVPDHGAPGPEARLDLGRLMRAFQRLSGALSPRQKAAFVLRDIEGLDTAEVARILDLRESTVRNHVMQARRVLREGLKREYPELVRDFGGEDEV